VRNSHSGSHFDWVTLLAIILVSLFSIVLLVCFIFPIYPDEIQTRFILSRLPYDFPLRISALPTCTSSFTQPIPATMYMPGLINWAVLGNFYSFTTLRLVGILIPLFWIAGLAFYLRNKVWNGLLHEAKNKGLSYLIRLAGFFVALFSVGVLPFFLVTNRQEQLLLPSVVLLLFIFLASQRLEKTGQVWRKLGLTAIYFISISLILYGHAKGLFLTPFFVIVGWQLFRLFNNRVLFASFMLLLGLHVIQHYIWYKFSYQCSDVPSLAALLKSFSLDPAALFHNPNVFKHQAYQSLMNSGKYLHQLGFQAITDSNYLPALPLDSFAKLANFFIQINFIIAFFTILVLLPLRYYRIDVASRRFVTINATLLILLVCLIISALFNLPKNWYDAGYVYLVLMIIWIFFIGENFRGIFQIPIARKIFIYLVCVALLSQAVLIHRYLPAFWGGYIGPSISVVNYDHSKMLEDLTAASHACDIDPVHSKKVIVDDYTYPYFHRSRQPMAFTYLLYGNNAAASQKFISEVDSDGLIARCSSIAAYMPFAKRAGDVCCVSKSDLNKLPLPY
jgi:hypothetical protein